MDNISIRNAGSRKNSYRKAFLLLDILVLAFLLTLGMTSNAATVIAIVVLGISFFFKEPSNIVVSMLFFYPFYNLFKFDGVGVSYYNILIAIAIFCLLAKENMNSHTTGIRIPKSMLGVFLFTVWCMLSSFLNGVDSVFSAFIDICIPLLFVACVINSKDMDIRRIIYAYSVGCIIAGLAGAKILPIPNLEAYIDPFAYRMGNIRLVRLQGLTVNPNYYSLDLNLAIAGLLSMARIEKQKLKPIEIIMIVVLAACGVMTLSKSFFVGLVLTIAIYMCVSGNLKHIAGAVCLGAVTVSLFAYLYAAGNQYVTAIFGRLLESDSLDGLTSSRLTIWLGYLDAIFSDPLCLLIGKGINAAPPAAVEQATHNLYIEILYYVGIIGGVLLFFALKGFVKRRKRKLIQYLLMGIFLIRAFAINLLVREAFMIDIMLVCFFLNAQQGSMIEKID